MAGRAAFAALALFALVVATERSQTVRVFREMGRWGLAMTVFLGLSSGIFLLSLNYTTVANVLFMQAAAPMMAALLGWLFLRERIDGRTWLSLLLAGAGVVLMAAGSFEAGAAAIFLPLVMTASFAAVIVIARHRRDVSMMPRRAPRRCSWSRSAFRSRASAQSVTTTGWCSPRSGSARWVWGLRS